MRTTTRISVLILLALGVACGLVPVTADQPVIGKAPPIPKESPLGESRSLKQVGLPAELTQAAIPADNPQTPEKTALGKKLFFDGRLSADGTVACATCHDPARAFTDGRPVSVGIDGRAGQRNAPTVLNALFNKAQFWDGRAKTLEDQAAMPIVNPVEMGQPNLDAAVAALAKIEEYQHDFQRSFGRPPNGPDLLRRLRPTSGRWSRSIPLSIISSPATRMPSTTPPSAAGSCSTPVGAATSVMP